MALVFVVAVELFGAVVHPVPPGFKGTMEEMCLHVERYPPWVLALVVPAWAGAAFASTWVSGRIGNLASALCIGVLLIAAVVFNVSKLPYASWFKIVILIAVPTAVLLGSRLSFHREAIGSNELK